jgi:hypothetical protein
VRLVREKGAPIAGLDDAHALAAMHDRGIVCNDEVRHAVATVVAHWLADQTEGGEVVVARGTPAKNGENGRYIWAPQTQREQPADADSNVDFYASRLVMISAGSVLAAIRPPTKGEPGLDVYGRPVEPKPGKPVLMKLCVGCHFDEPPGIILADLSGVLRVGKKTISVLELLEIRGNVDFSTGHLRAPADVRIAGDVMDLFEVHAGGSVFVRGDINGSLVDAKRDVEVHGALTNHRKGLCRAGGAIRAGLIDNSILYARGDVKVAKELVSSDTFAGGRVQAVSLRGGVTVATGGVEVRILGSPASARTLVVAGVDWTLPGMLQPVLAAVESLQKDLDKRMESVKLLRDNRKRLTAGQKETLTELEFILSEQTHQLKALQGRVEDARRLSDRRRRPVVMVRTEVYPGVELRLGDLCTTTTMRMAGPLSFQIVGSGRAASIAAVEHGTRPMVLPSRRLPDPVAGITLPM